MDYANHGLVPKSMPGTKKLRRRNWAVGHPLME